MCRITLGFANVRGMSRVVGDDRVTLRPPTFLGSALEFVAATLGDVVTVLLTSRRRSGRPAPMWAIWLGLGSFLAALLALHVWLG